MELHYAQTSGCNQKMMEATAKTLANYQEYLSQILEKSDYDSFECSINLPIDQNFIDMVKTTKQVKTSTKLKYIMVIGIGGSNLGTKAVYDAIFGFTDTIDGKRFPRLIFVETVDPEYLRRLKNFIQAEISTPEEIILNIISKSGTTSETVTNAEIIIAALEKKFALKEIFERIVVTTDANSKLWHWAEAKKISKLPIPAKIGGRYSVFSAVGLFPLSSAGIDIENLCEGAATMRKNCVERPLELNPALQSATVLFLNAKTGKTINDNFFFAPQLESLGKWYRQLMGESIGKENNLKGEVVHTGITPTVSIGSTDLHSVGQLYLGGPEDKMTTFVWARNVEDPLALGAHIHLQGLVENLEGKSAQILMEAILEGTEAAYHKKNLPFMKIIMPEISAFALGEFMQFKMIEMMYLAKLMNVNAFDQPNVELYKVETRRILK